MEERKVHTLDTITRSALMDINEDMSRYEQFLHWAIEGYSDFKFDQAKEVKTIEAKLTAWKAIKFPKDYIDWIKIGILRGDRIITFVQDTRIANQYCNPSERPVEDEATLVDIPRLDQSLVLSNYINRYGEDIGALYGQGVKHNGLGYFKIDRKRQEIQLSTRHLKASDTVYLEYLADDDCPTKRTIVNVYAAKLIKLYIHWQRLENNDRISPTLASRAERLYWNEHSRVSARLMDWNMEDLIEATRDGFYQSPKF